LNIPIPSFLIKNRGLIDVASVFLALTPSNQNRSLISQLTLVNHALTNNAPI